VAIDTELALRTHRGDAVEASRLLLAKLSQEEGA
jgi:hypothetical protein